ncbi:MAG: hypothetical protein AAF773_15635, partial [Cyanobacteria bacterium P01_D01_bin.115]
PVINLSASTLNGGTVRSSHSPKRRSFTTGHQLLENLAILGFTDFLDRMFSNNWWPVVKLRRLGLWLLRTVPPFKVLALKFMTGFWGRRPTLGKG